MGEGTKCHVCAGRFDRSGFVRCSECGMTFHENCMEYHVEYECESADSEELAVGAVEF